MMKKILWFAICLLFFATNLNALGWHPNDIEWMEIDTENVRVIFPKGTEKMAFRIADIINHINANNTYSIGERLKKLT